MTSNIDKTLEILRGSNDGNDLEPSHLGLVEYAVNSGDRIEPEAQAELDKVYEQVISKTYVKPFLCGVQDMTRDGQGYIYYKGKHVEHFTFRLYTAEKLQKDVEDLAAKCRHLEALGVEVSVMTTVWRWEEYENLTPQPELKAA